MRHLEHLEHLRDLSHLRHLRHLEHMRDSWNSAESALGIMHILLKINAKLRFGWRVVWSAHGSAMMVRGAVTALLHTDVCV